MTESQYPQSAQTHQRATASLPGGNTRHSVFFAPHPLYAVCGKGCRITDADGTNRIDCINNMSALIHGHGFPPVIDAVHQQVDRLLSAGMPTQAEVELAEQLCRRVDSVERVRFCTSGSESVMFALRAARAITGRNMIAKAEGAYHGSYDAMEYSLSPPIDAAGSMDAPNPVAATPGLPGETAKSTLVLPFNHLEATRELITRHRHELAAVIIDPCISRMGFVMGDQAYLEEIRALCTEFEIVLVFDEVFSFRIHHGGAQGAVGIRPDLSTFGKVIGGGLPIGAVGGTERHMAVFDQLKKQSLVEHSGTHFANPLSMVAGAAALQALDQSSIDHLAAIGDQLRKGIKERFTRHGIEGHAAGVASLVCAIFSEKPIRHYRDFYGVMRSGGVEKGLRLHRGMLRRGAHIVPGGGMILSSAMSHQDIEELLGILDSTLAEDFS
jgi:glutamate-1-semialdehyde 2,1-aminomutase